jgi:xylulokinase
LIMLLGLDLGTTNVKALVTDSSGRPLAEASRAIQLFHLGNGGVEQDIEEIGQATLTAMKDAVRSVDAAKIQAIGISSQGGALQMLDARGKPVGRVVSWLDERSGAFDAELTKELGHDWFAQRIGHGAAAVAVGQVRRLQQAKPARIGFVGDVIVGRLSGRAAHDGTSAGITCLYNPVKRCYDPDLLQRFGVRAEQFPKLLSPRDSTGGLLPEIARETGLRAGIPVSPAIHDQYAAALAMRAVEAGTVMVGAGTAWILLAVSDRWIAPVTEWSFECHHVVDGLWGQIVALMTGGSAFGWALELTGHGKSKGEEIDRLLESAPPGCDGLQCQPFLTAFAPSGVAPNSRGRLAGLQLSHQPAHIVRAVLEGLAFELRRHLDLLRKAGMPVSRLVLGGTVAASRVSPQILSDVCGLPLECAGGGEGSLLGAAIIARGLLEPKKSLADIALEMAPVARRVEPGPAAKIYQEQYERYLSSLPTPEPK